MGLACPQIHTPTAIITAHSFITHSIIIFCTGIILHPKAGYESLYF